LNPTAYHGSYSSSIEGHKVSVYYGPNEIDPSTGEYCFVVLKSGKEVFRRTNSQLLDIAGGDSPEAMLIAGLALYLNK
jgi:hypothetical protein